MEGRAMKPLPKIMGWVGAIAALLTGAHVAYQTGSIESLMAALGAIVALFSHSATGTGGAPTK